MEELIVKVICPTEVCYEGKAAMVEFTTTMGNVGIYARHIPMISVIAPGVLRIHEAGGEIVEFALHSGFAEILEDQVTIMAEACERPGEIDLERARAARQRAEARISSHDANVDVARAELALRRALVRINLGGK